MDINLVIGATSLLGLGAGVTALVFYRKNGNGHQPVPPLVFTQPSLVGDIDELTVKLDSLPEKLEQGLAPAFEGLIRQVAAAQMPVPPELVSSMQRVANRLETWSITKFLEPTTPPELVEVSLKLSHLADCVESLIQIGPPMPLVNTTVAIPSLPAVEGKLDRIGNSLDEILAVGRNRALPPPAPSSMSTSQPPGGSSSPTPPKRVPPPLPTPRVPPPLPLPATPMLPAAYVGGTVVVPATAANLLQLIQEQLAPNCPSSGVEVQLSADSEILVGAASALGGPLSDTNYAFKLEAGGPPRLYRSSFPGGAGVLGDLQVMGGGNLHVEVVT